eukprot:13568475-Alexandrium_andersonii.AAC.1
MLENGVCFCASRERVYMTPGDADETGAFMECPPGGTCPDCLVGLAPFIVPVLVREAIRRGRARGPRAPPSEDA